MTAIRITHNYSASGILDYIFEKTPHNDKYTNKRNLYAEARGFGVTDKGRETGQFDDFDIDYIKAQIKARRVVYGKEKKAVQGYHLITSYSLDDIPVPKGKKGEARFNKRLAKRARQAVELTDGFWSKVLPDNARFVTAAQWDADGGKLHCHTYLDPLLDNGHVLRTHYLSLMDDITDHWDKKTHKRIYERSAGLFEKLQDYMQDNFESVTGRKYKRVPLPNGEAATSPKIEQIAKRGLSASWKAQLAVDIVQAGQESVTLAGFCQKLKDNYGIKVIARRTKTGAKDAQGKPVRRLAFTYVITMKNAKGKNVSHRVRDYRRTYAASKKQKEKAKKARGRGAADAVALTAIARTRPGQFRGLSKDSRPADLIKTYFPQDSVDNYAVKHKRLVLSAVGRENAKTAEKANVGVVEHLGSAAPQKAPSHAQEKPEQEPRPTTPPKPKTTQKPKNKPNKPVFAKQRTDANGLPVADTSQIKTTANRQKQEGD